MVIKHPSLSSSILFGSPCSSCRRDGNMHTWRRCFSPSSCIQRLRKHQLYHHGFLIQIFLMNNAYWYRSWTIFIVDTDLLFLELFVVNEHVQHNEPSILNSQPFTTIRSEPAQFPKHRLGQFIYGTIWFYMVLSIEITVSFQIWKFWRKGHLIGGVSGVDIIQGGNEGPAWGYLRSFKSIRALLKIILKDTFSNREILKRGLTNWKLFILAWHYPLLVLVPSTVPYDCLLMGDAPASWW